MRCREATESDHDKMDSAWEGYPIEAIIVTCREEFNMQKEAITLNVYDYCVKPLDYIQMENIVKNLVQKIVCR